MWGISWLAENLLAFQEELCYLEEVSNEKIGSYHSVAQFLSVFSEIAPQT